jgi:CHAT domain-containing protein
LAQLSGNDLLGVEAADALAQLYESESRWREALNLNEAAVRLAARAPPGQVANLAVGLEWRAGRLHHQLGEDSLALASYLRAADHLEAVRQDLPIEDETGQSTYKTLFKPIFGNLVDLLLQDFDALSAEQQPARLTAVLDVVERTRQAEMQDFLGDRCSVESVRQSGPGLGPGVAVLYAVIIRDRLEVLVRTRDGFLHHAVPVTAAAVDSRITSFRSELVEPDSNAFLADAQALYAWLIKPFETQLATWGVRELVIVPDGHLRLIPFAALHDGTHFLAERYVISSVTGLTMTEASAARDPRSDSLLAGLSEPGPVVGKLVEMGMGGDETALRTKLALPGVKTEIQELVPIAPSVTLFNSDFTVARFQHEVATGHYQVIHIASHGFFGENAQKSFLLAFDDVIHIDDLQKLISTSGAGIDLLTLSACDTARGDDRAPLGFAGAAIKARARSVVGTLWAVNDEAAQTFMKSFYAGLSQQGKAQALTAAQRSLIGSPRFSHPYYWAPFTLVGDWN